MWRLEDLGETGDILLDIQARWETLRAEAELLVSSHHWSGEAALWTRGEKELEDSGRWQQLLLARLRVAEHLLTWQYRSSE